MYILFSVIFAGQLVSSVNMKLSYTGKYIFSLLCMWSLLVDWFVLLMCYIYGTKLHWFIGPVD